MLTLAFVRHAGYLPSFWIKLRLLSAPAVNSAVAHSWPVRYSECARIDHRLASALRPAWASLQVMFGGLTHWTVGLIATFISVACIIAADTGAYLFGKSVGRTQLTQISPKKTVEGAMGGLLCSVGAALLFHLVRASTQQNKNNASRPTYL